MHEVADTPTTPRAVVDAFAEAATRPLLDLLGGLIALLAMAEDEHGARVVRADGVAWVASRLRADANRVMHELDTGRRLAAERLAAIGTAHGAGQPNTPRCPAAPAA